METKIAWVIDPRDNVATILGPEIEPGTVIKVEVGDEVLEIKVNQKIIYGHKVAIRPIKKGETILKYNASLGKAMEDINVGDHVHIHNIEPVRGRGDLAGKGDK